MSSFYARSSRNLVSSITWLYFTEKSQFELYFKEHKAVCDFLSVSSRHMGNETKYDPLVCHVVKRNQLWQSHYYYFSAMYAGGFTEDFLKVTHEQNYLPLPQMFKTRRVLFQFKCI